jgi:hypothetical protein
VNLLTYRNIVGAETPIGRGLSTVNEQSLYRPLYIPQPWATHPVQTPGGMMTWQERRLARLSSSGSKGEL